MLNYHLENNLKFFNKCLATILPSFNLTDI
jgi:hypothetical protein